ncbi:MAG: SDR family NAD(P)-dependent oxidoreductase, partial [Acidimicrobiales bacterium]
MDIREFTMDLFSLMGRTAVVTGGNTGLGQAFSLALAKAGADLFIPTVMDDDGETRRLVEAEGRRAEVLKLDITATGAPRDVIEGCVASFGTVDIVVNSAGICNIASVDNFDRSEWDPMI